MKNRAVLWMFLAAAVFVFCSCTANYMIWDVRLDNGETLKVKLDIENGERLSIEDNRLVVRRRSIELLVGEFYTDGEFDRLLQALLDEESIEMLKLEPSDAPSYGFFQYEASGTGYGFLEKIEGSELSTVLFYTQSMTAEEAENFYHRLHFTLVE